MGKNIKRIIGISIISLSLFFSGCAELTKEEKVLVPVLSKSNEIYYRRYKVDKGNIAQKDKFLGSVQSLNRHTLYSRVSGARLEEKYFRERESVKKGDVIAKLYSTDLENEIELQKLSVQVAQIKHDKFLNENVDGWEKKLAQVTLEYETKKLAQLLNKRDSLIFYSPIDGIITKMINSKIGAEIKESEIIAEVVGTDELVIYSIPKKEIMDIYFKGMKAEITHRGRDYPGVVTKVDKNDIEGVTKHHGVFIEFKDEIPEGVQQGDSLECKVKGEVKANVLRIPVEALYESFNYKYVFVLENGIKVKKIVEVGMVTNEFVEITSGLQENEKVIIENN